MRSVRLGESDGEETVLFDSEGLVTQSVLIQHIIRLIEHEYLDIAHIDYLYDLVSLCLR